MSVCTASAASRKSTRATSSRVGGGALFHRVALVQLVNYVVDFFDIGKFHVEVEEIRLMCRLRAVATRFLDDNHAEVMRKRIGRRGADRSPTWTRRT